MDNNSLFFVNVCRRLVCAVYSVDPSLGGIFVNILHVVSKFWK